MTPPQSGGFVPVELPEINEGPHFWYAVQWFGFTGIAVAGIVVFIRGDLRRRGRPEPAARSAVAAAATTANPRRSP